MNIKQLLLVVGIAGWCSLFFAIFLYFKIRKEKKDLFYDSKIISKYEMPKVVVIGGGTGQSIFLRGLKTVTENITAVVTVSDDGGGSGVLREDLGMLPPGDIRNCILALADIEPTMNEVMQYRFPDGSLKGQSFGNLFLAALNGIFGNFETAVSKLSEVFAIKGRVLPVSLEDITLIAKLENGLVVKGESVIPRIAKENNTRIEQISIEPKKAKPLEDVIISINQADAIVIGPGSLYTSIIPNILMEEVVEAIKKSKAPKIYISNIMTQPGETDGYNVVDHVNAIEKHAGCKIIDYVFCNKQELPEYIFEKYQKEGAELVMLDDEQRSELKEKKIKYIEKNMLEIKNDYVRHNAKYISNIIVQLAICLSK
ncbi:MAG: YvcK family protein [Clostridioides sp.]|jgi:uncharacterized cofD-like protein|nr:YvcK family protein [Clostridioides sp.]